MGGATQELDLGPVTMSAMTAAWTFVYVLSRVLFPARSKDFCNRIVSLIHVFVSCYFCSKSVADWSRPLDGVGAASTYPQMLALTVSLAYFTYDTLCCLVELPFSLDVFMHHVLTILGLGFGYERQISGTELVACLMLMEVSNPFMHARELLKELNLKDSSMNLANDVVFALIFTVARVFIGPIVVYKCLLSSTTPFAVKVGAVGIQVVSLLWFYKIARMVVYKLSKKPKTRKAA
ncbi:uncharacterized protein [Physcomitrium patens]|uniref:TLC domain-containing protein n=1 Tax=Physcomitrium patens TaxID=3218 RepID=A0A2K1KAP6_PHYPA|nr:transmembrane protein 136-like [Physcomitrium patens]PNR50855.1 hypothetical protein PHYPA_010041 [Physcomitrium patens]|eukprot:XP_024379947.1 transmembrane protein 136-like [Physcomitrella patens]